ncbi:hypothetical protein D3C78_1187760 [compost metagenome]
MGEAHIRTIGNELGGEFIPAEEGAVLAALPGAGMHLIDADRLAALIHLRPMFPVGLIFPFLRQFRRGDGSVLRPQFGAAGIRVGLQGQKLAIGAEDFELVGAAGIDVRREDFPDAGILAEAHHMPSAIPIVEIADDGNTPRIGRPHGEVKTFDAFEFQRMRAHPVEEPEMRSFTDEIIVHGSENRAEAVGVGHRPFGIVAAGAVPHRLAL